MSFPMPRSDFQWGSIIHPALQLMHPLALFNATEPIYIFHTMLKCDNKFYFIIRGPRPIINGKQNPFRISSIISMVRQKTTHKYITPMVSIKITRSEFNGRAYNLKLHVAGIAFTNTRNDFFIKLFFTQTRSILVNNNVYECIELSNT